jgi:hypothetical protein
MKTESALIMLALLFSFWATAGCNKPRQVSLWERHCASCHDGRTVLNGKVLAGREQMKATYATLGDFTKACAGAAQCMNIIKHEENLFAEVGAEIGIRKDPGK